MRHAINTATTIYPDYTLSEPSLIAVNAINNKQFRITDLRLLDILYAFDGWISEEEATAIITEQLDINFEVAVSVLETLNENDLIIAEDDYQAEAAEAAAEWANYGWRDAFHYFLTTKDYPFIDYSNNSAFSRDLGRMDEYLEEEPIPSLYKTYDDAETIDLPEVDGGEFDPTFEKILSASPYGSGTFDTEPITRKTLGTVLYYTFGEIGKIEFPVQGKFLRRTSPSGGARHPTEGYVIVDDVEDVPPGLYHYSVKSHGLERLDDESVLDDISLVIPELDRVNFPWSFLIVYTSVIERNMWRYRESRTYRALINDIGHVIQTQKLVTKAKGWESYVGHGFHDRDLEELMNLDGFEEPVFRFAAIGTS